MNRSAFPRHRPAPRQRGSMAVETALALPILLGVGLIGSDMHRIGLERTRLENTAGSVAINLAAQRTLTATGLDALIDTTLKGHAEHQQVIVLHVRQSGRIEWALQRGGAEDLCEPASDGANYTGTLPEDPPDDEGGNGSDDGSRLSLIVVQACRDTSNILLSGGLVLPRVLEAVGVFRTTATTITLDEELQEQSRASGLAYIES